MNFSSIRYVILILNLDLGWWREDLQRSPPTAVVVTHSSSGEFFFFSQKIAIIFSKYSNLFRNNFETFIGFYAKNYSSQKLMENFSENSRCYEDLKSGPIIAHGPVPENLRCPYCEFLMNDPVALPVCGHGCCRNCLVRALDNVSGWLEVDGSIPISHSIFSMPIILEYTF